jgi:hypothetical protein
MITSITNFYLSDNPTRQAELDECLHFNLLNKSITQFVILCDTQGFQYLNDNYDLSDRNPVIIIGDGRPTYNDFFIASSKYSINEINILHNSDILIPVSSSHLFNQMKEGEVWALSRYDGHSGKLWNHRDSQDTWAWRGKMRVIDGANFSLGIAGCDNRISKLFLDAGFEVLNPSIDVRTVHLHKSNHRTYNPKEAIKPPYHFIQPHKLTT